MGTGESAARAAYRNANQPVQNEASQAAAQAAASMFKKRESLGVESANTSNTYLGLPTRSSSKPRVSVAKKSPSSHSITKMVRSQSTQTVSSGSSGQAAKSHRRADSAVLPSDHSEYDNTKKKAPTTWNNVNATSSSAALAAASLVAKTKPESMVSIPAEQPHASQRATIARSKSSKPTLRAAQKPISIPKRESNGLKSPRAPLLRVNSTTSSPSSPGLTPGSSPEQKPPRFTNHSNSSAISDVSLLDDSSDPLRPPKFNFTYVPRGSSPDSKSDEDSTLLKPFAQLTYDNSNENLWTNSTPSPGADAGEDYFSGIHRAEPSFGVDTSGLSGASYESLVPQDYSPDNSADSLTIQKAQFPNRMRHRRRPTVVLDDDEEGSRVNVDADADADIDAPVAEEYDVGDGNVQEIHESQDIQAMPRYPLKVQRGSFVAHQPLKSKSKFKSIFGKRSESRHVAGSVGSSVSDLGDSLQAQSPKPVHFKTTLRKEDSKAKKKEFNEAKPWKHHADSTTVTPIERKRYEGVWAANRGSYTEFLDADLDKSQLVMGIVVKAIWKRSRLHEESLSQIWNLVDRQKIGALNKQEFVVGTWLVDQCLYGKKLPKVVGDIVWMSVENSAAVNVTIHPKLKSHLSVRDGVKKVVGVSR
ncbi:unnamed protein product [Kuraishia capsulata CBS 1993]|uniref:EH domain-containing protein n=1 Tax=Kuraishia capsulata CBS 1993 TaxID=1382522 RepID=W6MUD6_9ASCO|nr:uncharacterized protein KUCA_T00005149001 [Kuraishia capsulata CBS 1993]CDK29162.1 unnamed protein product [Kuraishia capsulata CBS 1993]